MLYFMMDYYMCYGLFEWVFVFFFQDCLLFYFVDMYLLLVDGIYYYIQNLCIFFQQSCFFNCEYYVKGGIGCEFCMCDNFY